jgi:hypothetical protein
VQLQMDPAVDSGIRTTPMGPWPFCACSVTSSGGRAAASRRCRKATAVKLTLDSSEPLEDAVRVLGALYGVTLVVSSDQHDPSEPDTNGARKPSNAKKTAKRKPAAARKARPAASTNARSSSSKRGRSQRSAGSGSPSNAEVRSWARQHGFTVSDRGRLPASVLAAYRNA